MSFLNSDYYWGVEPISGLKMIILGTKTSTFGKKQNSLLSAHIMHIAHFLNLYGADVQMGHIF